MGEMNERDLLREFLERGSEEAFSELLHKFLPLVFSVAVRQTRGDVALAEEVAQETFCIFARKAGKLSPEVLLPSWLCRTALHVAQKAMRGEARRRIREQEAYRMQVPSNSSLSGGSASDSRWEEISPELDAAIDLLPEADRSAVILRYFQRKRMRELAESFGISEEAARMRVSRAVDRLRTLLVKRGLPVSTAALAFYLQEKTAAAVPSGMGRAIEETIRQRHFQAPSGSSVSRPEFFGARHWLKIAALTGVLMITPVLWVKTAQLHRKLASQSGETAPHKNAAKEEEEKPAAVVRAPFDFESAAANLRKALRDPWPGNDPPCDRVDAALADYKRYRSAAAPVLMEMLLGERASHTTSSMILAAHGLIVLGPDAAQTLDDLVILHASGDLHFLGAKEGDLFAAVDMSGTTIPNFMKEVGSNPDADGILIQLFRNNPGVAPFYRDQLLHSLQVPSAYRDHAAVILVSVPSLYDPVALPALFNVVKNGEFGAGLENEQQYYRSQSLQLSAVAAIKAAGLKEAVPQLIEIAKSDTLAREVRDSIFAAVASIDPSATSELPEVAGWQAAHDEGLRLADKARNKEASVDELIAGLGHSESVSAAAKALADDKESLPRAVPQILRAIRDFGDANAIVLLHSVPASELLNQMKAGNTDGLKEVIGTITESKPDPAEVLPVFDEIVDHLNENTAARGDVIWALQRSASELDRTNAAFPPVGPFVVRKLSEVLTEAAGVIPDGESRVAPLLAYLQGKVYARPSVCRVLMNPLLQDDQFKRILTSSVDYPVLLLSLHLLPLPPAEDRIAKQSELRKNFD
jgi:RNA polymerase sigma factor (sigma-70 family)